MGVLSILDGTNSIIIKGVPSHSLRFRRRANLGREKAPEAQKETLRNLGRMSLEITLSGIWVTTAELTIVDGWTAGTALILNTSYGVPFNSVTVYLSDYDFTEAPGDMGGGTITMRLVER